MITNAKLRKVRENCERLAIKKPQRHWQVALELLSTQPPPRLCVRDALTKHLHLSAHCGDDSRAVSESTPMMRPASAETFQ